MAAATAIVSLCVIYIMLISDRYMKKVVEISDPFSNTKLLMLLLAFCDLQRVIFKLILYAVLKSDDTAGDNPWHLLLEITRMRYAIMQVELLFISIPMRHNFAMHKIELS